MQSSRTADVKRTPMTKSEGTVSDVFASLSGESVTQDMPARFLQLKQNLVRSPAHAEALQTAWTEVLHSLQEETAEAEQHGASLIPQVAYPGDEAVDGMPLESWIGKQNLETINSRGTVIVKGVVPLQQALQWKQDIRDYVAANPQTRGFPDNDPQVFELYWSKAQLAARGHPSLLRISRALLALFHAPSQAHANDAANRHANVPAASLRNTVSYCDRLRIRMPGDAAFALGPHIDGGGVERWEDPTFRDVWQSILQPDSDGRIAWRKHDSWSLGTHAQRLGAQTDMYGGAGACSVFRPLQGWLSMSSTGANEGTLRVLPILQSASTYIILRPFFRPIRSLEQCTGDEAKYLSASNWRFDLGDSRFDGCSLGHNIELNNETHPHLKLDRTMTSIPRVEPGDCAFWHCDVVHAVESKHGGLPGQDSSVLYIPAIPLTQANFDYIIQQRATFRQGIPPPDFPGGAGESTHRGRGVPADIKDPVARRAMGLMPFELHDDMPAAERRLIEECNAQID